MKFSQNLILPHDHAGMIYTDTHSEIDEEDEDDDDTGVPKQNRERRNAYKAGGDRGWQGTFIMRDIKEENARKANFKSQMRLLARLKAATQKDNGVIQEEIADPKNPNYQSLVIQPYGHRESRPRVQTASEKDDDGKALMVERLKRLIDQIKAKHPEKIDELLIKLQMTKTEISKEFTELENQRDSLKLVRILT